ncbi:hypothetical protein GDO78_016868 [Eleutherodactylus coqui]|uniref:G-protein coupled receptors family 1 profile domain-containing protein n=1 Tax=Eleutherodactylus coqui TaxID=57060 RepID=A0A8J6EAC4_ELECQ|nr:hypothetical protein GDO78_016868 [Eleutherodactylus coqui]
MFGELKNDTSEAEFYISSFAVSENGRIILLITVLLGYLIILAGNSISLSLICLDPQLHTSMYFFLSNLACIAQLYLFLFFSDTESFLLVSMAIDRYVAICFPLHYSLIMTKQTFENFFCDLKALLLVSSSDTTFLRNFIVADGICIGSVPFLLIVTSYGSIIRTILKIQSSTGRWKTFSSCTSHITIVVLYYGSAMSLYMQYSQAQDNILSMIFVTLVPVVNPLAYTLRNDKILKAIKKVTHSKRNS